MVSNTKSKSNNIYLQTLIAEILRTCDEQSALSISEIKNILEDKYDYRCAYKTVSRNILGMSDHYKLLEKGLKPVRYWIDSYYEPDFKIELSPYQLQLILYSIKNLRASSNKLIARELKHTELNLLSSLPSTLVEELKYALKSYSPKTSIKPKENYPKNNINEIFTAIRKKRWVTAKVKNMKWPKAKRHQELKMAIRKIFFKEGIPYIEVYFDELGKTETISASICNSIKILNEIVPRKFLTS